MQNLRAEAERVKRDIEEEAERVEAHRIRRKQGVDVSLQDRGDVSQPLDSSPQNTGSKSDKGPRSDKGPKSGSGPDKEEPGNRTDRSHWDSGRGPPKRS